MNLPDTRYCAKDLRQSMPEKAIATTNALPLKAILEVELSPDRSPQSASRESQAVTYLGADLGHFHGASPPEFRSHDTPFVCATTRPVDIVGEYRDVLNLVAKTGQRELQAALGMLAIAVRQLLAAIDKTDFHDSCSPHKLNSAVSHFLW
jgi:hypothetical protein